MFYFSVASSLSANSAVHDYRDFFPKKRFALYDEMDKADN